MPTYSLLTLFQFDRVAAIISCLVIFIGIIVGSYSIRAMKGDRYYFRYFVLYVMLILSVMLMSVSDNLVLFVTAWGSSNILLVYLMIHKSVWSASLRSGLLAGKILGIGLISLIVGFVLLYFATGQLSLKMILQNADISDSIVIVALIFIMITAMSQSAIWPFHRWLTSSLNSPTPISAIMHAGLVNGGGVLLVRFAPLYLTQSALLTCIFIVGLVTVLLGTFWKLIQSDVKRMLACSTMSQMGYMIAQCGLGLFPAAVAHLCWHGLFKANLFLASSGSAEERIVHKSYSFTSSEFMISLLCGLSGSYLFMYSNHMTWLVNDTRIVLIAMVYIVATQFSLSLLQGLGWKKIVIAFTLTNVMCVLYGFTVNLFESVLEPLHIMVPQPLNGFHYLGLLILVTTWLVMVFKHRLVNIKMISTLLPNLYVKALNASQPHPLTITSNRNEYQYK